MIGLPRALLLIKTAARFLCSQLTESQRAQAMAFYFMGISPWGIHRLPTKASVLKFWFLRKTYKVAEPFNIGVLLLLN